MRFILIPVSTNVREKSKVQEKTPSLQEPKGEKRESMEQLLQYWAILQTQSN